MTSIDQKIERTLKNFFGFDSFKGSQKEIINSLCSNQNTFVVMPTGGGKSLCYQLPAMIMDGTAIIVSPLIAMMKNQVDLLKTFGAKKVIAHFLNSSLTRRELEQVKKEVTSGLTKMLYVAPETFSKEDTIKLLKNIKNKVLVLFLVFLEHLIFL